MEGHPACSAIHTCCSFKVAAPHDSEGGGPSIVRSCAHRTSTVSSCAFCEQEGYLAASPSPLIAAG